VSESSAPGPLLHAVGVRACYESVEVIHGVDLEIAPGSVTAILGPNGAGKSTLLSVLAGFHDVSDGRVLFDGQLVTAAKGDRLVRQGLCLIPEGKGIFPNLTVQENLWMMSHGGASRKQIESRAFEQFPQLSSRRQQQAGTMSGGEQQMLAMARAVATQPRLLLLDELSMGLAPIVVESLYNVVRQLANDGVTIIVVEQFAEFALDVAEHAAVMTGGRIVHEGPASEVGERLHDLYLGTQHSSNGSEAAGGSPAL
jgi:branched-chain amino acid transport system ATP-binding protein